MRNPNKDDGSGTPTLHWSGMREPQPVPLYLREVLGVSPPVQAQPQAQSPVEILPVVVVTEELSEQTKPLLDKILASIRLTKWQHQETNQEPTPAMHRLLFSGDRCERRVVGNEVQWHMPRLTQMLGDGPEVTVHKRAVWSLLQEFSREIKTQ